MTLQEQVEHYLTPALALFPGLIDRLLVTLLAHGPYTEVRLVSGDRVSALHVDEGRVWDENLEFELDSLLRVHLEHEIDTRWKNRSLP
jgi:hypothetical protein